MAPKPETEASAAPRLGRYELLTRIAAGGMAEVFVARARGEGGFERLVAVKRMLPTIAEEEHFAEMFLDEGRIAGLIDSPHVVQIYDVGRSDGGELFIAMELVRGLALHKLLAAVSKERERLPVSMAVAILAQAADGLGAAHTATTPLGEPLGIVHRDVSPQNILVGADGRVRVADFGVARAVHRRTSTSTGELKGKLAYFAPEQLRSQPATPASDVFALGIVAWEALAMRRLFQGEHPVDTIEKIRGMAAPPLETLRSDVPIELARAVDRALTKDPARRTQTARRFASELREAVEPADAAALAAFVRSWGEADLRALEERVRLALAGKLDVTSQDIVLPEADRSGVRSADEDGATTVTPSTPHHAPAVAVPDVPTAALPSPAAVAYPPAAPSRAPLWAGAALLVLLAVVGAAFALRAREPTLEVHSLPTVATVPVAAPVPVPAPAPIVVPPPTPPAELAAMPVADPVVPAEPEATEPEATEAPSRRHGGSRGAGATGASTETAGRTPEATDPPAEGGRPRGGLRGLDSFRTEVEGN